MDEPMLDDHGYPTEELLGVISSWRHDDKFLDLMKFIKAAWHFADWGWTETDATDRGAAVRRYDISTGGWSGNESLIAAMQDNQFFWMVCWCESRRGGHYVFEVRTS